MLRILRETMWDEGSGLLATRWFPSLVLLIGALLVGLALTASVPGEAPGWGYDYKAFRTGAEMTAEGRLAEAYDPDAFLAALSALDQGGEDMFWMYPPHGSLLMAPLSLGSYAGAAFAFLAVIAGAIYAAGRLAGGAHRAGALLLVFSVPSAFALLLGQAAPLFGALLVFALLEGRTRPVLAGAALALVTVKPHYGLMVPLFLLCHGQWRVIAAAGAGTVALVGLSLLSLGAEPWAAWIQNADGPARAFIYDNLFASMPSFHQYLRLLGAPMSTANAAQALAVPVGLLAVWATRRLPYRQHVAATLLTTCAVMPYLWFYDWLPVMAAILILGRGEADARPPLWLLATLWIAPLVSEVHEGTLGVTNASADLWAVNLINVGEVAALWGVIGWLVLAAWGRQPRRLAAPPLRAGEPTPSPAS